jgi:hypothetical protein
MIIHPDGRLEGTPEELAAYQKAVQAAPIVVEKPVPVYVPYTQPATPVNPLLPQIWCGSASVTHTGPDYEVRN